jgi:hypothetical protein
MMSNDIQIDMSFGPVVNTIKYRDNRIVVRSYDATDATRTTYWHKDFSSTKTLAEMKANIDVDIAARETEAQRREAFEAQQKAAEQRNERCHRAGRVLAMAVIGGPLFVYFGTAGIILGVCTAVVMYHL